eukprot:GILK01002806.1.p1 GENE.GILK01002806.1~~GILK01002806.1.p1  ORF type:complete len:549 (+),score=31.95 GILK01002806.1:41-1687(+)
MAKLWVRGELFDHGVFPCPTRFSTANIIENFAQLRRLTCNNVLHRDTWMQFAQTSTFALTDEEANLYFDTFSIFETADYSQQSFDVRAFSIFILLQTYSLQKHSVPAVDKHQFDATWPSTSTERVASVAPNASSPHSSPSTSPLNSPRSRVQFRSGEESHRLAFVRQNMRVLLRLVSSSPANEEVSLTAEEFDVLGILVRGGDSSQDMRPLLSSFATFYSNPSLGFKVHESLIADWMLKHVAWNETTYPSFPMSSLSPVKSPRDFHVSTPREMSSHKEGQPLVLNGLVRDTILQSSTDLRGCDVHIVNCAESVIYIAANSRFVSVLGCKDILVVVGAASGVVTVDFCERVTVTTACRCFRIGNSQDCSVNVACSMRPIIYGDSWGLVLGPHNAHYPQLRDQIQRAGLRLTDTAVGNWTRPFIMTKTIAEPAPYQHYTSFTLLEPDKFTPLAVPTLEASDMMDTGSRPSARHELLFLPAEYEVALKKQETAVLALQRLVEDSHMSEEQKKLAQHVTQGHFREWLVSSGNVRQLVDLIRLDQEQLKGSER